MEKIGFLISLPEKKGQSDLFSVTYGIFRTKTGLTALTSGKNRIISPGLSYFFQKYGS
jgi:hypothetical protein